MSPQRIVRVNLTALVLVCLMLVPRTAWTQGTSGIAGVVKDTTGSVLPGVTVEAASPVLIEKVRTVITDDQGQYRILSLLPGTYTVTFTLTGFSTVKREGLELTSNFTAPVDAELKVGSLAETVTVSGQSPVVDVQNVVQSRVVSRELLFALPINREMGGYAAITPGAVISANQQDVGGNKDPISQGMSVHGNRGGDTRVLLDGMRFNAEGSGRGFYFNPAAAQEVSVELGGQMAEYELAGVQVNLIPKEGGNVLSGFFFGDYTNHNLTNENLTDEHRARGLKVVNKVDYIYDANMALGGPIFKDKLWFFTAQRWWAYSTLIAGNYYNKTQNTLFYTPDLSRRAFIDEINHSHYIRFTWQASQKNKVNFSYEIQDSCLCHVSHHVSPALVAPEATGLRHYADPNYLLQAKWSRPATNKLLFEAGGTTLIFDYPSTRQPGAETAIAITEASTNYQYGAKDPTQVSYGHRIADQSNQRFAVSYVTGSHAFRTGILLQEGWHRHEPEINGNVNYTFLNAKPLSLQQWATPLILLERLKVNAGIFAQDQWTIKNLTLNLGMRFDYFNAFVPEQHLPAGPFVPARDFARVDCVSCWKDFEPRLGAAYDLFGNGKTAIKASVGRYVAADIFTISRANNPVQTSVNNTTRTWNDINGDFVPDCDLANPFLNNECGQVTNLNFGKTDPRATTYASDVLTGWGHRNYSWQASASLQHELRPGVAVNVGYFRTWYGSFWATDNQAVTAADFDQYSITAPVDPRLPGGGGYVIPGLYDITPAKFGQARSLTTQASHYGKQIEIYNGVDLILNARLPNGSLISGGMNTGRTETNNCAVVMNRPQITFTNALSGITPPRTNAYCDVVTPWLTQVKLSGTYNFPWGLQTGVTYQNLPGIPIFATYVATNDQIAPSLGRPLAAGARGTATVDLIAPQTQFEKRITQLDIRVTKIFRLVGRTRLQAMFNIYNALNASPILSINTRYGPVWKTPTEILAGRLFKFGAQLEF